MGPTIILHKINVCVLYLEQLRAVAYVMAVDIEVLKSSSLPGTAANPLSVGPPPRGRTMLNLSDPLVFFT